MTVQPAHESTPFVAGGYWTPELADAAVARMLGVLAMPEFQQLMQQAADAFVEGHLPEPPPPDRIANPFPDDGPQIARDRVLYRRGEPRDVAPIAQLMMLTDLPPLFIEEFLGGFVVAEHEGEFLGCGGLEVYGECGAIRSVATVPRARGYGLGRRMAELLVDDAKACGAREIYLFTADAHPFWLHLGFDDVTLDEWSESPRRSWQYQYVRAHPEMMAEYDVHSMRMRV